MGSGASHDAFDYDAQLLADDKIYAQFVEGDEKYEDSTPPIRNTLAKDGLIDQALGRDSVWGLFQLGVEKHPDSECYGTRSFLWDELDDEKNHTKVPRGEYQWLSYKEVDERARMIGSGLRSLGFEAEANIGIYSLNRTEWMLAALGAYSQTMRVVALYATLGEDAVQYIANHAELPVIFVSKENLPTLVAELDNLEHLSHIVQFDVNPDFDNRQDTVDPDTVQTCADKGVTLIGFTELLENGREHGADINEPAGEDLCLIMYTSGTTGKPKGVMLMHRNFGAVARELPGLVVGPEDRHYSYLPLAHSFETVIQCLSLANGVSVGFFQGNIKKLPDDLSTLQPTFMAGVPRVFQKMYDKVFEGVKDRFCVVRYVFHKAYAEQCQAIREGRRIRKHDEDVFQTIKEKIGMTKIRTLVTGGAPCPPYLLEFLKVVVGCSVLQGYGLTETAAGLTVTYPEDITIGHVGPPAPWAEIRLKTVEEMGYKCTDNPPTGEVQVRGAGVFRGYYKNEEATAGCFDDGWFCTGDIGRFNQNGTLSIIDRKKNILKLSQGEYVAVEKVEGVYSQSTLVGQIYVYGNSYKSYLVAVVVPSAEAMMRVAGEKGWWSHPSPIGSPEFCEEFKQVFEEHGEALKKIIVEDMEGFNSALKGFEKVKKVILETTIDSQLLGFNIENECLTPTFKLRRPFLRKRYLEQLKEAYTELGSPPKADERW